MMLDAYLKSCLLLVACLCAVTASEVNTEAASGSCSHAYIVCRNGYIAHYVNLAKIEDLQLSDVARVRVNGDSHRWVNGGKRGQSPFIL